VNGYVCIDACVALKWVVPEADSETADALLIRITSEKDVMIAPPHMLVEVVNALRKKVLRKEITPAESEQALATLLSFPISIAMPEGLYESALLFAQRFDRATVYDTHYLALAQLADCEMWTADQRLLNALGGRLPFVKSLDSFPVPA
jgi:predicted nucleic acid-binding protein